MLNLYNHPLVLDLQDELRLKYWQLVLRLTRLAATGRRWVIIFNQHRLYMLAAFVSGVLIGLIFIHP